MSISVASVVAICSVCGESLNRKAECLACMLRVALEKSDVESAAPVSLGFGDFEIVRREDGSLWELGRGAMGVTYLAVDNVLRRKVALKVIEVPATGRNSEAVRERFLREARAAAALRHPNVAAVFQFGASPDGRRCHYAMELVEGETLEARVRRDGPLDATLVLEIASQISRALTAAAASGLVHRDLKPGNIMLASGNGETVELEVKVIDFGLAKAFAEAGGKMDQTKGFVGTPNFASPEQFEGGPVDVRSDIYSLGVTLWFALTGRTPFAGRDIEDIRRAQKSEALPVEQLKAARVPFRLSSLLRSMLAIEPAARPGVKDLAMELRRCSAQANKIRRRRIAVAASLILIFGVFAVFVFHSLQTRHKPAATAENWASNPPVPEKSIAVLPFENASNEPNSEYLSEGISEALINSLSELQQLRVIARPTAFHYKQKDIDPRRVGRELGAAAVLTGKVRQIQDALSVQVDLVDTTTGVQIWGAAYDRKITDLVAVKQAIAQEVTAKLKLKLSGEEQRRLVKRDSTNAEAYQFYLRGRYFWNKRTSDGIKQAIEHFQRSIERDPNFALGYVGLADSYTGLTFYNFAAPHEAMPKAKESAIKALTLDNTLAEAHATLAHILINYDWNPSAAEKEFKRSIELKPDYATAHQWYAIHYLTAMGWLEEALQEMKKALELEPASLVMNTFMGATLYYADRYEEAIDQCRRTIQMDPNFAVAHWHLGLAYEEKQLLDAATQEFEKAISMSGGSPLMKAALGRAYAKSQKTHEANKMLKELDELAKQQYVSAYEIATIHVALGNKEQAFQLLEQAYREHSFHLVNLNVSPQFRSVRSDPRFQDLIQRLGLSKSASNPAVLEKRIAVLPFENLSKDEENAFFVGGMQDEILTNLARVADLKVISRTSVMKYKSDLERDLREIAKTLAVSHVVEGSVQRAGGRVRVNVQLIDARTDTHLWAEHYDRNFADVFAIQSEIAQAIVDELQAKLSPIEKAAIAEWPTKNLDAYDLYLRAKELIYEVYLYPSREKENALKAVQLLDQAVARDPSFLLAHCQLAYEHDLIYFDNIDHTETRLALAETSVRAAVRLQPDAGETHLAQAIHFYWGYRNYDRAREELAKAQRALPNNAEIFHFLGLIAHRQGRWDEIVPNLEHAVDLDPRNASTLLDLGEFYAIFRKHREAIAMFDRAVAVEPRSAAMRMYAALIRVEAYAEIVPLRTVLNTIEAEGPVSAGEVAVISFELALRERDPIAAARAVANLPSESYIRQANYVVPRAWHEGLLAKLRQDAPRAQAAFMIVRAETEKVVHTQPQNVEALSMLALIDAELGDKEKAIREGRTACDMVPVSKDASDGTRLITILASIYALSGEKDLALKQLETVSKIPSGPSYGALRLDPEWDLLRGDPRFEKIVASLAPK